MRILVTGADGFLGSHITDALLNDGHEVVSLFHPQSAMQSYEGRSGVQVVEGDILDPESLTPAMKGVDAVIHTAAHTGIYPRRQKIIWDINLNGTQNLARAAQKAGVQRFVCIGTANSFGRGTLDSPGDETRPYMDSKYGADYMDSKRATQEWLLDFAGQTGFPALFVNPCFMIGPGDRKPGSGVMMLRLYGRKVLPISTGGRNFVDVRDVARGAVNALTMGRVGECYICGNENMPYTSIFPMFAKIMDFKSLPLRFPKALTLTYGFLSSVVAVFTRKEPAISTLIARISFGGFYYSSEKAREELKLPSSSVEQAAKDAFKWFQENGYVE